MRNWNNSTWICMWIMIWRLSHCLHFVLWLNNVAWILFYLVWLFVIALMHHEFTLCIYIWILRLLQRLRLYDWVSCKMSWTIVRINYKLGVYYAINSPIAWQWSTRSNSLFGFLATPASNFSSCLCAPSTYCWLHRCLPTHYLLIRLFSFHLKNRNFITW